MGRTEFLTETDCERALVGRAKAKASTRAKWRSSSSACRRVLEKCLTPPTLLEMGIFQQLPPGGSSRTGDRAQLFAQKTSFRVDRCQRGDITPTVPLSFRQLQGVH